MLDDIVYLDLETTGGSALYDRIIEVGLVVVEGGRVVEEWSTLVDPGRHIPQGIQTLTGITDAMVSDAPAFGEIAPALARRLEGRVLAAHNARFDYGFVRHELARAGIRYRAPVLCTVKLSRRLFPQHRRHNLDALIVRHALFCLDRHRALGDARALWELAAIWKRELGESRVADACAELMRPPAIPPQLPAELLDDLPEAPGVYLFRDGGGSALYVGRGANIRSRVLAHFSGGSEDGRHAELAARVAAVEWIETGGELGASLREAELIRAHAPGYNRRHPGGESYSWRWDTRAPLDPPRLVEAGRAALRESDDLYGVFRSRAAARSALRGIAHAHGLCLAGVGLEQGEHGQPCSARAEARCRGACIGAEHPLQHAMRLTQALAKLRVPRWPYPGPIAVRERSAYGESAHAYVLDQWCYLGTARSEPEVHELSASRADFDPALYRIIAGFLKAPPARCEIVPLAARAS